MALTIAPLPPTSQITKSRADIENGVQRTDPFRFVVCELPVVQARDRRRAGSDQPNPHRCVGSWRKCFIAGGKFVEIQRRRNRPCAQRHIGYDRMQGMTEPCSMQKIPHFLRDRILLIERYLCGRIQHRFDRLEPFLFVDQVSYAFHTSKSKHGAALVRPHKSAHSRSDDSLCDGTE